MSSIFINKKYLKLLLLIVALFLTSPFSANAGPAPIIASTPCDNAYYESLTARAWLEAQREITQNQNIILKPDSVLEYTCFDQLVWELADHADEMLSETNYYNNPLDTQSMDNALSSLVLSSIGAFVQGNYRNYPGSLGGHPAGLSIKHDVATSFDNSFRGSSYNCDIMKRVWHAAKCINFITDPQYDGFFTFNEYVNDILDKRHLPSACMPITNNWAANLTSALTSGPWTNDPVQTYLSLTAPQECSSSSSSGSSSSSSGSGSGSGSSGSSSNCPCSGDPIPTGVKVKGKPPAPASYDEKICLQPGCRYHPGGFPLIPGGSDVPEGCYGR